MVCFAELFYVGFLPKNINLKTNEQSGDQLDKLAVEEYQKWQLVPFTNAVTDPRTMMVIRGHAMITVLAVLTPQRLLDVADRAIFVFEERYRIIRVVIVVFDVGDFVIFKNIITFRLISSLF